ncbi:hypothetical protein cce_3015 [Crocosphaera subtropica ATCC 51142]|uniref:Uncharacterized protein n=1 Tax=Crocosphaera subtropica (strain ATCC 51142 / BH68) TaxID=43989 RepID=B1WW30_CROS5|nr:hypothetical protein [Crocosphaera subtropica]ACB52363.1 hypothetical protein cce_3015 [Crocosphaera subtropica ATCC 51142]
MFLDEVSFLDIFLEGLKVLGMIFLLLTLVDAAEKYPSLAGSRWNLIILGFVLMLVGFAFDWSDEFINYEASSLLNIIEVVIEEVGLIGGLFLVTFGFKSWFRFMSRFLGISSANRDR